MKKYIITASIALAAISLNAVPMTWELMDANQDGTANLKEFIAAQKVVNPTGKEKAVANWFKNWDKDSDGKITKAEFDKKKAENAANNKGKSATKNKGQQGDAKGKKKGNK